MTNRKISMVSQMRTFIFFYSDVLTHNYTSEHVAKDLRE